MTRNPEISIFFKGLNSMHISRKKSGNFQKKNWYLKSSEKQYAENTKLKNEEKITENANFVKNPTRPIA